MISTIETIADDLTLSRGDHQKLKKLGVILLLAKGFARHEISEEHTLSFPGCKKTIVADVVAFSKTSSAVVECGNTPSDRVSQLKLFFDEVLLLPYVDSKISTKEIVKPLSVEIQKLEEDLAGLKSRMNYFEAEIHQIIHDLNLD